MRSVTPVPSWPGLIRPSGSFRDLRSKAVGGRVKPDHDGGSTFEPAP
jgi:hypothetical protein